MTEQNVVWIVELRVEDPTYTDTVMHVASSLELAEAWIKQHPDASDGNEWHWWIGKDLVDDPGIVWDHDWRTYHPNGTARWSGA